LNPLHSRGPRLSACPACGGLRQKAYGTRKGKAERDRGPPPPEVVGQPESRAEATCTRDASPYPPNGVVFIRNCAAEGIGAAGDIGFMEQTVEAKNAKTAQIMKNYYLRDYLSNHISIIPSYVTDFRRLVSI
jgi:hypothetical protein